jgi:hypothetical protein
MVVWRKKLLPHQLAAASDCHGSRVISPYPSLCQGLSQFWAAKLSPNEFRLYCSFVPNTPCCHYLHDTTMVGVVCPWLCFQKSEGYVSLQALKIDIAVQGTTKRTISLQALKINVAVQGTTKRTKTTWNIQDGGLQGQHGKGRFCCISADRVCTHCVIDTREPLMYRHPILPHTGTYYYYNHKNGCNNLRCY